MREIVSYFKQQFQIENIDWKHQMMIAKKLLKQYSVEEIIFAIDYYSSLNKEVYSLGYFLYAMETPLQLYKIKEFNKQQRGDSSDRNKRKFRENNETWFGKEYYIHLFEEPEPDNNDTE